MSPAETAAAALLTPQEVPGRDSMPLAEVAARIVLGSLDGDDVAEVLLDHQNIPAGMLSNRCTCGEPINGGPNSPTHVAHVVGALLAWLAS